MSQTDDTFVDEVARGGFIARRIADTLAWGEGAIRPAPKYASPEAQRALVEAALDSIEPVAEAEAAYSSCTDGRLPVKLQSDEPVPVREQMVGADIVSAFFVAELLGERFYRNATAPVVDRLAEVAAFLHEHGLLPSSHVGCGAAAGFTAILQNIVRFSANPACTARLQALLPEGMFDAEVQAAIVKSVQQRLAAGMYEGLTAETFLQAARESGGDRAIAELKDDGRGVHGHVEEAIMRLRLDGQAINEAKVAELTAGREVFGVNDTRMDRLARLFAQGNADDERLARVALENFATAGHATLAQGLPTYVITKP